MHPAAIRFNEVGQVYRTRDGRSIEALRGVSFDVARHEFIAVVGSSGCGKSTLLRLTAGLVQSTNAFSSLATMWESFFRRRRCFRGLT
jgi:NitT/TauT family transport system ATP-binding protein